jgi:hypothetical protein
VHAQAFRQLALGESRPTSIAQYQSLKVLVG